MSSNQSKAPGVAGSEGEGPDLVDKVGNSLRLDGTVTPEERTEATSLLEERLNERDGDIDEGVIVDYALEDAGIHRELRIHITEELF